MRTGLAFPSQIGCNGKELEARCTTISWYNGRSKTRSLAVTSKYRTASPISLDHIVACLSNKFWSFDVPVFPQDYTNCVDIWLGDFEEEDLSTEYRPPSLSIMVRWKSDEFSPGTGWCPSFCGVAWYMIATILFTSIHSDGAQRVNEKWGICSKVRFPSLQKGR